MCLVNCDLENFSNGFGGKIFKVVVIFDSLVKIIGVDLIFNNISMGEVIGVGVCLMNKD